MTLNELLNQLNQLKKDVPNAGDMAVETMIGEGWTQSVTQISVKENSIEIL